MSSQPEITKAVLSAPAPDGSAERRQEAILVAPVPVALPTPTTPSFFHNVDGGVRGWAAVAGAWLFQFSMLGLITAFGSYQTFYEDQWLKTYSDSSIAWIGSLQLFMEFFLGVFGGFLLDAGHWRLTVGGGSVLFVFTFFMLSLCRQGQYAPILLSQGIGMGAGLGFAFLPVTGIVSKHFTRRRSLAMGIITTGTSLGGFAFSALASKLLDTNLGFPWTVRASAFIALGCILLANFLVVEPKKVATNLESEFVHTEKAIEVEKQPSAVNKSDPTITVPSKVDNNKAEFDDAEAVLREDVEESERPRSISQTLRDPAYLALILAGFTCSLGLYFPMFVIQSFALEHGISPDLAAWLLSIINLSSVFGRTIPNWLADHYGMFELYVPCNAAAGVLIFALGAATNPGSIVVVCILYGFFSGSIVSLYFPTVCSLDPHVTSAGMRLGIACLPVGFASLIGTPIAEALIGSHGHWWHGLGFAGAAEMVSSASLAFAWAIEKKRRPKRPS